jgi:acetyl esterase
LATRLTDLGVDVETLFYAADRAPALGHQYQFELDSSDARAAWRAALRFMRRVTGTPG